MRSAVSLRSPLHLAWGLFAASLVACSDSPSDPVPQRDDAIVTVPPNVSAAAIRARTELHKRNRYDWVGVAHNRAIDDFRKELRKPGVISRNMCSYLSAFSASAERIPADRRGAHVADVRPFVNRSLGATRLCGGYGNVLEVLRMRSARFRQTSSVGDQLLANIESATDASTNSYELALQLQPIVEAATGLDSTDQTAVLSTASVAQSSAEYWETEMPAFQQELANDYSACASQYQEIGYSSGDALQACMNSESRQALNPLAPDPRVRDVSRPINLRQAGCHSAWEGWRRVAKADARGARDGFISGLIGAGTLAGGTAAGIAGAAGKSITEALFVTWDLFWCAMH